MSSNTATTFDSTEAISSLRAFLKDPKLKFPCLITYDQRSGKCATLFDSLIENTDTTKGQPPEFTIYEGEEEWDKESASYINGRPPSRFAIESIREPFHANCWYIASPDDADRILHISSDRVQVVSCRLDLDLSCEIILEKGREKIPPQTPISMMFPDMTWKSLLGKEMEGRDSLLRMTHFTPGIVHSYEDSLGPGPSKYSIEVDLAYGPKVLTLESNQFEVDPESASWNSNDRESGPKETLSSVNLRWNVELDPEKETVVSLVTSGEVAGSRAW